MARSLQPAATHAAQRCWLAAEMAAWQTEAWLQPESYAAATSYKPLASKYYTVWLQLYSWRGWLCAET